MAFIAKLLQIIGQKFYRSVPYVAFYQPHIFGQLLIFYYWLPWKPKCYKNKNGKKYINNYLLRNHMLY